MYRKGDLVAFTSGSKKKGACLFGRIKEDRLWGNFLEGSFYHFNWRFNPKPKEGWVSATTPSKLHIPGEFL